MTRDNVTSRAGVEAGCMVAVSAAVALATAAVSLLLRPADHNSPGN